MSVKDCLSFPVISRGHFPVLGAPLRQYAKLTGHRRGTMQQSEALTLIGNTREPIPFPAPHEVVTMWSKVLFQLTYDEPEAATSKRVSIPFLNSSISLLRLLSIVETFSIVLVFGTAISYCSVARKSCYCTRSPSLAKTTPQSICPTSSLASLLDKNIHNVVFRP